MQSIPDVPVTTLLPQHRALIEDSAIAPDVAAARGYRSVTSAAELRDLGFAESQCRVPSLLVPVWDVDGRNGFYQVRPDAPRTDERGKPVKYETPARSRMVLDVPPSVLLALADPKIPLYITEGIRKADSAASHGLCCIALLGVWNWRGTNEHGGKVALADWESIALNDRDVRLAFDSDVMMKPQVREALRRLAAFLASRDARVRYVLLPAGGDGTKTGLDDYFVAGGTVDGLAYLTTDALPEVAPPPYPVTALPPAVARFVAEAATALAAPPEFVALPLLVFAAGAIGNTRYVQAKRGYTQPAILWGVTVGPPGSVKTPALEVARAPLSELQRTAKAAWDTATVEYETNLAHWQDSPKADRAAINKPTPPRPIEHFLTTDSTKEALAVMAATSAGTAAYRDEIGAWVAAFDAYRSGRGGDRQDMLSLWSGVMLKIDRKNAAPIVAERPAVSIVGGIQPDRLPALAGEAGQDGFLDRFLWAYPDVRPMRWTDAEVSKTTRQAIAGLFGKLRAAQDDKHPDGWPVTLGPEAFAAWVRWYDDNAEAMEQASSAMRGVYAKLPNQLLRLALVLHCLAFPEPERDTLSLETLEGAVALVEYHLAHAERVMDRFPATATEQYPGVQGRILRILRKYEHGNPARWMPRSAIYNGLRNVNIPDFDAALDALEQQKAVEWRKQATRTKPVEEWRILQ